MIDVQAQEGGSGNQDQILPNDPNSKLSYRLQLLTQPAIAAQDAETQARMLSLAPSGPGSLTKNEQGNVLVYIRLATITEDILKTLTSAGANPVHIAEDYGVVTAYVNPGRLNAVAGIISVKSIQEVIAPGSATAVSGGQATAPSGGQIPDAQADCSGATTSEETRNYGLI